MSVIKKGTDFGPTEQVTSTKLDDLVDNASFTDTSANPVAYTGSTGTCLNGGGLEVTSAGQLQIKDSDVSTAKLADDAVTQAKTSFIDADGVMTLSGGDPKIVLDDTSNETENNGFIQSFISGNMHIETTKAGSDVQLLPKDALIVKNDGTEVFRASSTSGKDSSGTLSAGAKISGDLQVTGGMHLTNAAKIPTIQDDTTISGTIPRLIFDDTNNSVTNKPMVDGATTNGGLILKAHSGNSDVVVNGTDEVQLKTSDTPTADSSTFVERFKVAHNAGKDQDGNDVAGAKVSGGLYVTGDVYADDQVVADNLLLQGSNPTINFADDDSSGNLNPVISGNSTNGNLSVSTKESESELYLQCVDNLILETTNTPSSDFNSSTNDFVERFRVANNAGMDVNGTLAAGAKVSGSLQVTDDTTILGKLSIRATTPELYIIDTANTGDQPLIKSYESGTIEVLSQEASSAVILDGKASVQLEVDGSDKLVASETAAKNASFVSNQPGVAVTGNLYASADLVSNGTARANAIKIGNDNILDLIHPIGSVISTTTNYANSAAVVADYGGTTWVRYAEGRMLLGFGEGTDDRGDTVNFNSAGAEAGEYQHVNTSAESGLPAHTHGGIFPAGSAGSFSQAFDVDNPGSGDTLGHEKFTTANTAADATSAHNNMPPYKVVYMWTRTA